MERGKTDKAEDREDKKHNFRGIPRKTGDAMRSSA